MQLQPQKEKEEENAWDSEIEVRGHKKYSRKWEFPKINGPYQYPDIKKLIKTSNGTNVKTWLKLLIG